MAQNDTAALVVALSAQMSKFEKDMKDAVTIADRGTRQIENRFAAMNGPVVANLTKTMQGIGGVLGGIGSNFLSAAGIAGLGLSALLATAVKLNSELGKIPGLARLAGISTERLQEIKFAGAVKGVGDDAFVTSLDASVRLLDEAQRQVNTLSRLFNANGLSIRNQNGELIKFDQLLEVAAKLMVNARTEQEKIKVAEMLGLSREWVAVLRDGPEAFRRSAQAAHEAGAVIDKQVLEKAKQFDREWNAAVVKFKAGFTEALSDLSDDFSKFWESLLDSVPGASFIRDKFTQWFGGLSRLTIPELRDAIARAIEQGAGQIEVDRIQAELDRRLGTKPLRIDVPVNVVRSGSGEDVDRETVIPKDKQKNVFDSAVFEANKRIAALDAETLSLGFNTDARERAKLVAELEEAAKKANTDAGFQNATVTDLQRQKINELADAMQAATRKQSQAHAELARFIVEGRDFVKNFDHTAIASLNNFGSALGDIITGTATARDAFRTLGTQVVRSLTDMLVKMLVLQPIAEALRASLTGGGFGFALGGSVPSPAKLASGGFVDGPGTSTSDSVLARLSSGEFVVRAEQAKKFGSLLDAINTDTLPRFAAGGFVDPRSVSPSGSGGVGGNVTIINQSKAEIETRRKPTGAMPDFEFIIRDVVAGGFGRGDYDGPLGTRVGASPRPLSR